jgi:hypothetical protein
MRIAPELTDSSSALEVGEHEDVEQLGASGSTRSLPQLSETLLQLGKAWSSAYRIRVVRRSPSACS